MLDYLSLKMLPHVHISTFLLKIQGIHFTLAIEKNKTQQKLFNIFGYSAHNFKFKHNYMMQVIEWIQTQINPTLV